MKKKVFLVSLLLAVFMMSVAVFAESETIPFDGGGYGIVTLNLENSNWRVRATSRSYNNSENTVLSTRVWGIGSTGDSTSGDGRTEAIGYAAVRAFTGADSNHLFLGRNWSLHITA